MRFLATARLWSVVAALVLPVAAWAQTLEYSVLVDTDTDETTGCDVDLPVTGVTVLGIERRLSATVDPVAAQITGVTLEVCEGAGFGAPTPVAGTFPYPVGTNSGAGGEDVVELAIELGAIAPAGTTVRLYAVAQTTGSDDLLATVDGTPTGAPILLTLGAGPGAIPIPVLSGPALTGLILVLAGLGYWRLRRARAGTSVLLLSLTGLVLAATPDGDVSDWAGQAPVGTDAQGDSASPNTDLAVLFADVVNGVLCLRIDVADLEARAPTVDDQMLTTDEDTDLTITLTGSDVNGDSLTFTIATGPTNGSLGAITPLTATSAEVTYTPNSDFNGTDSFTFTANDGIFDSASATVEITVNAINDAPDFTAGPDQTVLEDAGAQTVAGWATDIDDGDDGTQTLSFNITGNTNPGLFAAGPAIDAVTGDLSFTPADDASGSATLTVELMDDGGTADGGVDTSPAQSITITITAVDDPPTAVADTATVTEDDPATTVDVLVNDTDIDAGPISITSVTQPANGTVVNNSTNLTYEPNADFCNDGSPTDDFTYTLTPGGSSTTVSVTVTCVNDPPQVTAPADFSATGNVGISSTGLLNPANISDADGASAAPFFIGGTLPTASANGGTVAITDVNTGDFTYTPPAGFEGADTFQYQVCDSGVPTPSACSAAVTVTVNVRDMIWFIDNSATAAGNGTLATPFNTLSGFDSVNGNGNGGATDPAAGDCIFIDETGSGNYTGGVTLENNQILVGSGASATIASICGITLAPDSDALPSTGGADPTLTNSGGHGITLASGNTVRGLTVGNTSALGIVGTSAIIGTLTITETSILQPGGGIALANGNVTATFDVLESSSNVQPGIRLINTTGTLNATSAGNGLTGSGTASQVVSTEGGSVDVTYPGTVSQTGTGSVIAASAGHTGIVNLNGAINATNGTGIQFDNADGSYTFNAAVTLNGGDAGVDILNGSAGDFTFTSGSITSPTSTAFNMDSSSATVAFPVGITQNNAASAVSFTNNTGSVSLSGDISASTTTANALVASGGGTINVTGATNTIATTTGIGVNIANTTIGTDGVTFQSIDVDGATNGIVLTNTGTSGGFAVTGDGTSGGVLDANNNASGGTISNTTSDAIFLLNTGPVVIQQMLIGQTGALGNIDGNGILADGIASLTVRNTDFINVADQNFPDEAAILVINPDVSMGVTLANNLFNRSFDDHVRIENARAGVTAGVAMGTITITANNFDDNDASGLGNDAVLYIGENNSFATLAVHGNRFFNSDGDHIQIALNGSADVEATIGGVGTANNTTSNGAGNVLGSGFTMSSGQGLGALNFNADPIFRINSNSVQDAVAAAINVNMSSSSTGAAIYHSTVNVNIVGADGDALSGGFGITLSQNGAGNLRAVMDDNQVHEYSGDYGQRLTADEGVGRLDVAADNNLVTDATNGVNFDGIGIFAGATSTDVSTTCADLTNNDWVVEATPIEDDDYSMGGLFSGSQIILPGSGFTNQIGAATIEAFLAGQNTSTPDGLFFFLNGHPGVNDGSCTAPLP